MDDIGKWWNKKRWYSFCSRHQIYNKNCNICNTGGWRNVWLGNISSFFYKVSPKLWIWWVNK